MATIAQYLQQRRSYFPDKYVAKIELLDYQENVLEDITSDILDGSVDVNLQNGSRRSANIKLMNKNKIYNLNPNGKIWLDTKFKLSTGIMISGVPQYYSQGIYVMGEPNEGSSNSSGTVDIQLYDKFSLLDGTLSGTLLNSMIVPVGSNIVDVVDSIFVNANVNQKLLNYTLKPLIAEESTVTMPYTLRIDEGSSSYDMLIKLAEAISREIYFDIDGFPRFESPTNYLNEPSVLALSERDKLKLGLTKQYEITNLKNSVRVVGGDFDTGEIFDAVSQDTNVLSPTRIDRIGRRELFIQDDIIYSTTLAQLRADYELAKAIQATESVNCSCVPLDFIDVGNIINITDSRLQVINERYLVKQISFPLLHGQEMSMDVWRTRSFT